ncbi:hypothetical protein STAS_14577 [Striga asiatica]|uniref:Uncharacterized protein n=1 Tax=Striga asiatica TaxID=4170 RepID=A0A5A7PZW9_STRAF|nr:hypothetical protein STAS_14577 [Striga asiatica]
MTQNQQEIGKGQDLRQLDASSFGLANGDVGLQRGRGPTIPFDLDSQSIKQSTDSLSIFGDSNQEKESFYSKISGNIVKCEYVYFAFFGKSKRALRSSNTAKEGRRFRSIKDDEFGSLSKDRNTWEELFVKEMIVIGVRLRVFKKDLTLLEATGKLSKRGSRHEMKKDSIVGKRLLLKHGGRHHPKSRAGISKVFRDIRQRTSLQRFGDRTTTTLSAQPSARRVRGDDGYVGKTDIQVFQLRATLPVGKASYLTQVAKTTSGN